MAWIRPSRDGVVWDGGLVGKFQRACFNCEHIRVWSSDLEFFSDGQKRKCVKGFRPGPSPVNTIDFACKCSGYEYCKEFSNRMFTGDS